VDAVDTMLLLIIAATGITCIIVAFVPTVNWLREVTLKKAMEERLKTYVINDKIQTIKAVTYAYIDLIETSGHVMGPVVADEKIAAARKTIEDLNGYDKTNKELQDKINRLIELLL
jgi:hypothetical protein